MDRFERQAKEYARRKNRTLYNWNNELYEIDENNEPIGIYENYKEYLKNKIHRIYKN